MIMCPQLFLCASYSCIDSITHNQANLRPLYHLMLDYNVPIKCFVYFVVVKHKNMKLSTIYSKLQQHTSYMLNSTHGY